MADDIERAWYSPNAPKAPTRQPRLLVRIAFGRSVFSVSSPSDRLFASSKIGGWVANWLQALYVLNGLPYCENWFQMLVLENELPRKHQRKFLRLARWRGSCSCRQMSGYRLGYASGKLMTNV